MSIVAKALASAREAQPDASQRFRIKAGRMLAFDNLAQQEDDAERQVLRRVVRKHINRNLGCMALPLTLGYFGLYTISAYLHEDITNVFFNESELRNNLDDIFSEVATIPDMWDALEGPFLEFFFQQYDMYSRPHKKVGDLDKWGTWGRVLTYSQLQGAIRFEQSREDDETFGSTYYGPWNAITKDLYRSGEGFLPTKSVYIPTGRRLRLLTPPLKTSLPVAEQDEGDRYRFWLFPSEHLENSGSDWGAKSRIDYFKAREWLDTKTDTMTVTAYLLNFELGRPRLVEVKIFFSFGRAGGIFYRVYLQTMMLKMFPNWLSMLSDFLWFCLLLVTTVWRGSLLWRSFMKNHFVDHFFSFHTVWEWMIIMAGWFNVYGFYAQTLLINDITEKLDRVRDMKWDTTPASQLPRTLEMFDTAEKVSWQLGWIRVLMANYCLVLMFRFFISFAAQPRLSIVTRTLKAILPDLGHFLIVFLPTFLSYVISGNLLFGRRIEVFATVQASWATCFRIIMECEFDWDDLSMEYYWTTAIWVWSFIILLVLLMLNMVLAIILDIYNDVRSASQDTELVWTTLYHYWLRFMNSRTWIQESKVEQALTHTMQKPMLKKEDFHTEFPGMPAFELNSIYRAAKKDMLWEAKRDLDKSGILKVSGSVKIEADQVTETIESMNTDDNDLMKGFVVDRAGSAHANSADEKLFLTNSGLPMGSLPHLKVPGGKSPQSKRQSATAQPEWLRHVDALVQKQKRWMLYIHWELQQLQWQVQMAHMSKSRGERNDVL